MACAVAAVVGGTASAAETSGAATSPIVAAAQAQVKLAQAYGTKWDGPTTGPKAQKGKSIVVVSMDQSLTSNSLFVKSVQTAAKAIGWKVTVIDGKGTGAGADAALGQARALKPDGIVLGSVDAQTNLGQLTQASSAGIKIVGWHSGCCPGPAPSLKLFANLNGDPKSIGSTLANYAIATSNGSARVVIVTDDIYAIAKAKAQAMKARIEQCKTCQLLEYAQAPFADITTRTGPAFLSLYQKYSSGSVPYFLTVADVNYDFAVPSFRSGGVAPADVKLLGADGTPTAYERIRKSDYQLATVPEPLVMQGWQAVDELNRAFAGRRWSGYKQKSYLVTKQNINRQGGSRGLFIPQNGFVKQYKRIWGVR
jgi:ribose transport system substrate-binding protein